ARLDYGDFGDLLLGRVLEDEVVLDRPFVPDDERDFSRSRRRLRRLVQELLRDERHRFLGGDSRPRHRRRSPEDEHHSSAGGRADDRRPGGQVTLTGWLTIPP